MSTVGSNLKPKNTGTNGQTKKLVIKPLKLKPQLPPNFEDVTWAKLQDAIQAVHHKRPVACSLEELYRAVEDLCIHKMDSSLYRRLQAECDAHIAAQLSALRSQVQLEPVAFLDRVDAVWQDHCSQMLMIRSIFLYLDRTYVIGLAGMRSLFDMGLAAFRQHLQAHPEVEARLVQGLLALIERERCGEAVDRALLASLLRCLNDLGIYANAFQVPFLEETSLFYRTEGERLMAETDVPEYLALCEARLQQENERCQHYVSPVTRKALLAATETELISRHLGAVLEKGYTALMDAHRVPDLARLYTLSARVSALDALKAAFREYITTTGARVVKDEEKDKEMVEQLLGLKRRLDEVLQSAFANNDMYANALKDAFESFINQRQNKPAELIAKFIDGKLRAGNKGLGEEELEGVLDQALTLFRFIQGKDVFEAFYKKDLAKRLLLNKSASIDAEKSMISKLKAECGAQFTTKFEGMFKDMDLSRDIMAGFKQVAASHERAAGGLEMSVSVLTSGFWPSYPMVEVNLPQELSTYQQLFSDFYLSKQGGRKLVWHNSLGTCMLRAHFPKGTKELSVSLFQTVVLMLFNDADSLSLEDIRQQSGIEDKELRRTLQSLACGKVRVLRKEPAGRDVDDGDVFHFNASFSEKLFRIKINAIQMKETPEENKKTNDQVLQDRQYQIDAAIVRIMKTRKSLSHKLLVAEVLQQLKFPLRASDLKKRIESLIEREYLARHADDPNMYNYLA